jgi:hypothetical protein
LVHAFNKLGTGAVGAARQFVATLAMGALYRAERSDDAAEFWRVLEHVEALNAMAGGALLAVFTSFGTENP